PWRIVSNAYRLFILEPKSTQVSLPQRHVTTSATSPAKRASPPHHHAQSESRWAVVEYPLQTATNPPGQHGRNSRQRCGPAHGYRSVRPPIRPNRPGGQTLECLGLEYPLPGNRRTGHRYGRPPTSLSGNLPLCRLRTYRNLRSPRMGDEISPGSLRRSRDLHGN